MNKKILFVDDEPWLSLPLRLKLEAQGYICESRTNMTEGMQYLKKNTVSVLVTDIMMPAGTDYPEVDSQNTGFFFVETVRREFKGIGIVCLSVIGDQDKIEWLKKQGALYLRKGETPLANAAKLIVSKESGVYSV